MAVSELSCRRAGPIRRTAFSDLLKCSQRELLGICARRVLCWPVIPESGLLYAGADRGKDGEKVESAKENRAVPSRVTHAATRMTDDE